MPTAETIHREMIDAIVADDFDRIRELLHPEYAYTGGDGQQHHGPEAGLAVAKMYKSAFPDMQPEILSTLTVGDTAITEFRVRATHQGPLGEIAATGRSVDVTVCNIVELRDGKIYREREYFDSLTMMSQLGVVQPPGA
jgi:predicted ester cyclase